MRCLTAIATAAFAVPVPAGGAGHARRHLLRTSLSGIPRSPGVRASGHHRYRCPVGLVLRGLGPSAGGDQGAGRAFRPEHDDAEINGSGFAMLFSVGESVAYVKATHRRPRTKRPSTTAPTRRGLFVSQGRRPVRFSTWPGPGQSQSTCRRRPVRFRSDAPGRFVLTYDGINAGEPDWVDRAPGGTAPGDAARGADFQRGSCIAIDLHAPDHDSFVPGRSTSSGSLLGGSALPTGDLRARRIPAGGLERPPLPDGTSGLDSGRRQATSQASSAGSHRRPRSPWSFSPLVTAKAKLPRTGQPRVSCCRPTRPPRQASSSCETER